MPRLLVIVLAYLGATLAATATTGIGMWIDDAGRPLTLAGAGGFLARIGGGIAVAAALTAGPAIAYAERRAVRAYPFYALAGLLAGLVPLATLLLLLEPLPAADRPVLARVVAIFAAAGLAGGSAYWAIAGRRAGAWD